MADPDMLSTPISKLSLNNTPPLPSQPDKKDLEPPSYQDLVNSATQNPQQPPTVNQASGHNEQLLDLGAVKSHYQSQAQPIIDPQDAYDPSSTAYLSANSQQPSYPFQYQPSYPPGPEKPGNGVSQSIRNSLWKHRHTISVCVLFLVMVLYITPKMLQYAPNFSSSGFMVPKLKVKANIALAVIMASSYYALDKFVLN